MLFRNLRIIPFHFESLRVRLLDPKLPGRVLVCSQDSFIKAVVSRVKVPLMLRVVKSQQLTFPLRFFLAVFSVTVNAQADRLGVPVQEGRDRETHAGGNPSEHGIYDAMAPVGVISMGKKHEVRVA